MTDRELIEKAWGYLASYTVGERPNASEVNDLGFILERRLAQPERHGSEHYRDMYLKVRDELAALQQRPWVGLTDEEIKSLPSWWPSYEDAPALIELVKDVEAKLREKNGGV
jgi:hypothetical protein